MTAAGLPRRVMTTCSCWDISTHSFIFFCRSRAFTAFIKYPRFWFLAAFFERLGHRQTTPSLKYHKRPGSHRHATTRSAPPSDKADSDSPEHSGYWITHQYHGHVVHP